MFHVEHFYVYRLDSTWYA